jgi:hypothetical protein
MKKHTATITDISFEFDYARISNDGKMTIEFVNKRNHKLSSPQKIATISNAHSAYDEILHGLKECGALAPIVISKGA